MNNPDEVYRAHLVYMNLLNGEEAHVYSKPYTTKGAATRAKNSLKKETFHTKRRTRMQAANWGWDFVPDPSDTRTHDELLPFYESFVERSVTWDRV